MVIRLPPLFQVGKLSVTCGEIGVSGKNGPVKIPRTLLRLTDRRYITEKLLKTGVKPIQNKQTNKIKSATVHVYVVDLRFQSSH